VPLPPHHPFRSPAAKAEYEALYAERAKAWPVPSETRTLDTPTGLTHVRVSGPVDAPPLLLLHGARGNSLMWVPNIAALAAQRRVYALDTPEETGLSSSRAPITKPDQLRAWLDEAAAALVPDGPLSLAGMSYGGWLAADYARRHPGRVRRLVLLSPALTVQPISSAMILRAMPSVLPGAWGRRTFYYWLLADAVNSGPAGKAYVDQAIADWVTAERCHKRLHLVTATVLDDATLRGWQTPTLYLVGENEKIYSAPQAIARLNRLAPQIKTRLIPGAGHDVWYTQAERVNAAIVDFLNAEP
jgi:pimeloyl-ACP methyl ester carboxylesterase